MASPTYSGMSSRSSVTENCGSGFSAAAFPHVICSIRRLIMLSSIRSRRSLSSASSRCFLSMAMAVSGEMLSTNSFIFFSGTPISLSIEIRLSTLIWLLEYRRYPFPSVRIGLNSPIRS